jgi:hypothetical protein
VLFLTVSSLCSMAGLSPYRDGTTHPDEKLKITRITAGEMQEQTHLETLFRESATREVLRFIGSTEVGKRLTNNTHKGDLWDVKRLDSSREGETMGDGNA